MTHEQRRVRICQLVGGSGVPEWRDDDGDLRPVVPLACDGLLHRVIPGAAGVALALDDGFDATELGDDIDALIADRADVPDAPAGAAQHLGAVALVVDRAHGGEVEAEFALAAGAKADGSEDGQGADHGARLPRVFRGEHQ